MPISSELHKLHLTHSASHPTELVLEAVSSQQVQQLLDRHEDLAQVHLLAPDAARW